MPRVAGDHIFANNHYRSRKYTLLLLIIFEYRMLLHRQNSLEYRIRQCDNLPVNVMLRNAFVSIFVIVTPMRLVFCHFVLVTDKRYQTFRLIKPNETIHFINMESSELASARTVDLRCIHIINNSVKRERSSKE